LGSLNFFDGIPEGAQIIRLRNPDSFTEMGTLNFSNFLNSSILSGSYVEINLPCVLDYKFVDVIPDVHEGPINLFEPYKFTKDFQFGKITKHVAQLDSESVYWRKIPSNFIKYFSTDAELFLTASENDIYHVLQVGQIQFTVMIKEPVFVEPEIINSIVEAGDPEHITFQVD